MYLIERIFQHFKIKIIYVEYRNTFKKSLRKMHINAQTEHAYIMEAPGHLKLLSNDVL